MDETLKYFTSPGPTAVVGASSSRRKFGRQIFTTLRDRGVSVYPVNRNGGVIDGMPCFRSLAELPEGVENAVVVVRPEGAKEVVEEAIRKGIKRLWFQQGADFSKAAERAKAAGISIVTGKCILMYATPVTGIHRFHQTLARWFGKY